MISDFQRNGWVRDENLRLPEGTTFKAIADYRCADREPHGRNGPAAAIAVLGPGARDGRGQRRQPRTGGGQQRAGAPRTRRPGGRNPDRLGAARRARVRHVSAVHARALVHARHRAHRRRRAEAGQRVSLRRLAGAAASRAHRRAVARVARGELLSAEGAVDRYHAGVSGGHASG